MPTYMSMTGNVTEEYVIVTPRKLLFDGDGPPFYQEFVIDLEDAQAKASRLKDAKIIRVERVTVEGFFGILTRRTEVAN